MYKNTIKRDSYDKMMYDETVHGIEPVIDFMHENTKKGFRQVDELLKDTYFSFYKMQPEQIPDSDIDPSYRINKEIIKKAMLTEEYSSLRQLTVLDEVNSAFATVSFLENIQPIIDEFLKNRQKNKNQQNDKNRQNGNNKESGGDIKIPMSAIQSAMSKAADSVNNLNESMAGLSWGNNNASVKKVDPKERIKLANLLEKNYKLRELAKIIGKMKMLAASTNKSRVKQIPQEMFSITQGDDLSNILPSEVLMLADEDTESIFYKKLVEKNLLSYDIKAAAKKEKGDIYVCIDLSGSMRGEKEMWAKAVALSILSIAKKENRGYALIPFGNTVHTEFIHRYPKNKYPTPEDITSIAEVFTGGGTNFNRMLEYAFNDISDNKYDKADILFISDGLSSVDAKKYKKQKQDTDTRIISVAINSDIPASLREISDMVVPISELTDISAEKIFKTL